MVEAGQVPAELCDELGRAFWMGHNNLAWRDMTPAEQIEVVTTYLQTQKNAVKAAQENAALEAKRLAAQPAAPTAGSWVSMKFLERVVVDGLIPAIRNDLNEKLAMRDARIAELEQRAGGMSDDAIVKTVYFERDAKTKQLITTEAVSAKAQSVAAIMQRLDSLEKAIEQEPERRSLRAQKFTQVCNTIDTLERRASRQAEHLANLQDRIKRLETK